jgi:Kinesin motor domain
VHTHDSVLHYITSLYNDILLQQSALGGNCKTCMIGMISPALESMAETLSTVKFANRAKNIKNEAVVNEDIDQKSLLRKYEKELLRLRCVLVETAIFSTAAVFNCHSL